MTRTKVFWPARTAGSSLDKSPRRASGASSGTSPGTSSSNETSISPVKVIGHAPVSTAFPGKVLRPQRPVHEAARDAARVLAPTGLGLDGQKFRQRMVERLQQEGVQSDTVLQAMLRVERHQFVDTALAAQAYEDTSLPIGQGQTISKPSVVARMLEWLLCSERAARLGHLGKVLEIGTGCGYQTALLMQLSSQVVSIERLGGLHQLAQRNLAKFGWAHQCRLIHGDGHLLPAGLGTFDHIVSAAGGDGIPSEWLEKLNLGGRLVAPVNQKVGASALSGPSARQQQLIVFERQAQGWHQTVGEVVQFVPLKSGVA